MKDPSPNLSPEYRGEGKSENAAALCTIPRP